MSNHLLPAGKTITVTCAVASALVARILATGSPATASTVTPLAPFTAGPFPSARIYSVDGRASVAIADSQSDPCPLKYIAAAGALTVSDQISIVTLDSVAALTLAAPTLADEGVEIVLTSATARAHTLTATGLFFSGSSATATDLATFAAYKGAGLTLRAVNLKWHVTASVGITFSAAE